MKVYTKTGDDGTTGQLFGGRMAKNSVAAELNGSVDEAQAIIGVVRAMAEDPDLAKICLDVERDLWILMAEVATAEKNRHKLIAGKTLVTQEMVVKLEETIDAISERFEPPREFVLTGVNQVSAFCDLARTVIRRAERRAVEFTAQAPGTEVVIYLNRLSDLFWTLARWQEGNAEKARKR